MTPEAWIGAAVGGGLALVALALVWVARAIEDLTDVLGHEHDVRWEHVTDE